MKNTRCEEVIVHLVVRTYDELGRPTDERVVGSSNGAGGMEPIKVFRNAATQDFWGWVDTAVKAMSAPPAAVPPPADKHPKKRAR
jgi:hypothetical protein